MSDHERGSRFPYLHEPSLEVCGQYLTIAVYVTVSAAIAGTVFARRDVTAQSAS